MFFEKKKIFQKLHMIIHVFGEDKEIPNIAYDSKHFGRSERNSVKYI